MMVGGHIVLVPFPAQGHITPMLKLAFLLHHKGFQITFVHTDYNYKRLLKSKGPHALDGLPTFNFRAVPDGTADADDDSTQSILSLIQISTNCMDPIRDLVKDLNLSSPVTCMIFDATMSSGLQVAQEIGVPGVSVRTASACSFMCYKHVQNLVQQGIIPLKDESDLTNGYLDMPIEIPGVINIRLRDITVMIRTTNPDDPVLNFVISELNKVTKASAIIVNTFDALEHTVLKALSPICPPIYPIGPLHLLVDQIEPESAKSIGSSLWKEETECLQWLNSKEDNSVIYVNFGSVIMLSPKQLQELAWGLANSGKNFLWIIRPDMMVGNSAILSSEYSEETRERGLIAKWCPQEKVLNHPSIGGFLTHCGWNSMMESLCCGVPLLCSPHFADQHINCRYACDEWGIGMEIDQMKRDEVENLVRELLDGEKGEEMRRKSVAWKKLAEDAIGKDGSSYLNLDKFIEDVILSNRKS
uniref:Glycosyltransferase n=1 Tax=Nemophila menziesii TaxID=79376 RepID=A0A3B1F027_NEMME|nr:glucosyltransferase 16 [Nemophila menziesii]